MKRKKRVIIVCVAVALFVFGTVMIFSTGILIFNGRNAGMGFIPDIEMVTRIEMGRKYDSRTYSGGVVIEDRNEIKEILLALGEARKPIVTSFLYWVDVAHETPNSRTHLSISFGSGGRRFFYIQGNRGFVYFPYVGLYRINKDIIERLIQLYENHEPEWSTEN